MSVIRKYETIFIVNPQLEEEARNEVINKFKSLVEANGTLSKLDEWGTRKLAYEVQDMNEGYYVLIEFSSSPEFPLELERIYKITEGILKYLIIKIDE
ncbi:MAG: 30S ribosomal protein S6 [Eubacteriales bacterium]|nr:30S ribosomal protein S6 [Eubacteriales bacterium]